MKNEGKTDLRVFDDGTSWRYANLSFCVGDKTGGAFYIRRKLKECANTDSPRYVTLKPGEELLRKENLADDTWDIPGGFALRLVSPVFAVYTSPPCDEASKYNIWVGVVVNPFASHDGDDGQGGNGGI